MVGVYNEVDPEMAVAVVDSLLRHKWYLTQEFVVLNLFSESVTEFQKHRLATQLLGTEADISKENELGKPAFPELHPEIELYDLIGPRSWKTFKILNFEHDWLSQPVEKWEESESYQKMKTFVINLKVTNDAAERAIKLHSVRYSAIGKK